MKQNAAQQLDDEWNDPQDLRPQHEYVDGLFSCGGIAKVARSPKTGLIYRIYTDAKTGAFKFIEAAHLVGWKLPNVR